MVRFALDEDFPDTIITARSHQGGRPPLVHLPTICRKTVRSTGQIWRLGAQNKNHDDPWEELKRIAQHRKTSVKQLFHEHMLTKQELRQDPLQKTSTPPRTPL